MAPNMTESHAPSDGPQTAAPSGAPARPMKSLARVALEVALIGTGVFLGLAGEQWRDNARHREQAQASLKRFRTEIQTNRKAVSAVSEYHAATLKDLRAYFAADPKDRSKVDVSIQGLQPAVFEHTAWDLALATQSLADIDPALGFMLSQIYGAQDTYSELSRGVIQAMYVLPWRDNVTTLAGAADTYFSDVVLIEPKLLGMYDEALATIDRALGGSS